MKKISLSLILALLFCTIPILPSAAQDNIPPEKLAMIAALDFLDLADQGDFAQCWDSSSQLFRDKIDKETWIQDIGHMRPQYGKNLSRSLQYSQPLDSAAEPNGQPGLFLIFRANFADKTVAEMLTLSKDSDDQWRVAGYSIQ